MILPRPSRLLIVMPSWVGDTVMTTPALRALRRALPGSLLGGLFRPGLEGLLAGTEYLDEVHVDRPVGMMGPTRVASRLRAVRYDAAILFPNSFSTALITRLAGIPRRFGYDRDARGLLLTDRFAVPRRRDVEPYSRSRTAPSACAPIPACEYYFGLARRFLDALDLDAGPMGPMTLRVTDDERAAADAVLRLARTRRAQEITKGEAESGHGEHRAPQRGNRPSDSSPCPAANSVSSRFVLFSPGGNDAAKRWPAERFAELAAWLVRERGMVVLVSGAPAEVGLTARLVSLVPATERPFVIDLPALLASSAATRDPGPTPFPLALLKAIISRCSLMVTNDTGPRHIAAALGVPVLTLFGPTDHRWTTIPFDRERRVLADPTLPEEEVANDHSERCAIERIGLPAVIEAVRSLIG